MTTWTCRTLIAGAALAVLAACVPQGSGGLLGGPPARSVPVLDGAVTIAGPQGYCIDTRSTRARGTAAFVLLAPCARLHGEGDLSDARALMTATATAGPGPTADGYRRYFSEPEGLAALSSGGDGSAVRVERMGRAGDGSFRVTVFEPVAGDGRGGIVDPRSWRAFVTVNGQLVALSLRSPQRAPLSEAAANRLLDAFVAAIVQASAPDAAPQG